MKSLILSLSLLSAAGALAETHRWTFDEQAVGQAPDGFESARTGRGAEGAWVVEPAADAPSAPHVVRQTSTDGTSYRFPVLVAEAHDTVDGRLSVRFKAISGRVDQAAGLVWRYADEDNYYVVRANALEDNVVLYKVEKGRRSSLVPKGTAPGTYGVEREVPRGEWNTLTVRFEGPVFTVFLNDSPIFEVEDPTFGAAGRVGLWTKADSVTVFDDLTLESEGRAHEPQ